MVRQLLRDTETMLQAGRQFAPERSSRTFSVVASDYMTVVLLSRVAARLGSEAPNVRLDIIPPSMDSGRAIDNGSVDIIVGPEAFMVERFSSVKLFEEHHVLIGCAENPLFAEGIDLPDYIPAGHVVSMFGPERELSFADRFVEKQGLARRVEVTAGSFVSLPWLVIGTSRVAVIQQRLAELVAKTAPIAISELPFPMPLQVIMMQCHPARSADTGLTWLMKLIADLADTTPTGARMAG